MESSHRHFSQLGDQKATKRFIGGGKETLLNAVKLCRMEIPPSGALDMNGSLQLTFRYLLKDE